MYGGVCRNRGFGVNDHQYQSRFENTGWWRKLGLTIFFDNSLARWTGKRFTTPFDDKKMGEGINLFQNRILPERFPIYTYVNKSLFDQNLCLTVAYPRFPSSLFGLIDQLRKMLQLPEVVELIAQTLEPQHLPYYAMDIATVFHNFYEKCRVVSNDEALTRARLKLVEAARIVLARTLQLMGMTAPEKM